MVTWDQKALSAFISSLSDGLHPDDVGGKSGQNFGQKLRGVSLDKLPPGRLKRSEVFALVADSSVDTLTVCAAIMAWGGMNERFSPKFFSLADTGWLGVAEKIRAGQLHRKSAYASLAALCNEDKLYGLGPAYFTKIIYFLMPRTPNSMSNSYIMDQWAGCSVNVLMSQELVKMNVTRTWNIGRPIPDFSYQVAKVNTETEYDRFCEAIDLLRGPLRLTPDQVDRALVAGGGRRKSSWRRYVISQRCL